MASDQGHPDSQVASGHGHKDAKLGDTDHGHPASEPEEAELEEPVPEEPVSEEAVPEEPHGSPTAVTGGCGHPTSTPEEPQHQGDTAVTAGCGHPTSVPEKPQHQGDTGPQEASHSSPEGKHSGHPPGGLKDVLEILEKAAYETKREGVEEEDQSGSVSAEGRGADESGLSADKPVLSSLKESRQARRYEFSGKNPGMDGKKKSNAGKSTSVWTYFIIGAVGFLVFLVLWWLLCITCLCKHRKEVRQLAMLL
ncbi:uncharacterized protein LOC127395845 [Apus apus]|uniref:uncharacterized protein LOC127395845 n=1 Tax=Apus apus TaxID=8895 RepID=UPI0021F83EC3|nr:uncharacterized protein LOC127395845 [Apus apus]